MVSIDLLVKGMNGHRSSDRCSPRQRLLHSLFLKSPLAAGHLYTWSSNEHVCTNRFESYLVIRFILCSHPLSPFAALTFIIARTCNYRGLNDIKQVPALPMPIQVSLSNRLYLTSLLDYVFNSSQCLIICSSSSTCWGPGCSISIIWNQEHPTSLFEVPIISN